MQKSHLGTLVSPKTKVDVLQNIVLTPSKLNTIGERLGESYPGIRQMKTNMQLEFSNSEDVYLLRIPSTVDPCSLENVKINLEEQCKVKINGEKYCIQSTSKIPDPMLVVASHCNIVKFKGNIKMEKYIKSKKEPNLVATERESVPLPNNLKKRHPLFGSDYKHRIKLSEDVEKKLDEAIANLIRKEKHKKKKSKIVKHETQLEEGNQENIFALLNSHTSTNKLKKIKKEISDDSAIYSSSSIETLRKKDRDEKSNAITDTLERIKSEIVTETESDGAESKFPKRKKNKGQKIELDEVPDMKILKKDIKQEYKDEKDFSADSDHDSNKLSVANSTFMANVFKTPNFYPELCTTISEESSLERKSKKSKKKNKEKGVTEEIIFNASPEDKIDVLEESSSEGILKKSKKKNKERGVTEKMLNFNPDVTSSIYEESSSERKPKKSKKKDKERSVIEKMLISDILDSLKSDINSSKRSEKKKKHKLKEIADCT